MNPITFTYTGQITAYTVGQSGSYLISAYGAQGGDAPATNYFGGLGASVGGRFDLQINDQLLIIVGGVGENGSPSTNSGGGGGGGSFVFLDGDKNGVITGSDVLLFAAGGGGGAGASRNGIAGYSADDVGGSGDGSGGAGGNNTSSNASNGGGGAGRFGGGGNGSGNFSGTGAPNINSRGTGTFNGGDGGYGGGGGAGRGSGGGGGGYTGGVGGMTGPNGGGGGRSFFAINQSGNFSQSGVQRGDGLVEIVCYAQGTRIRTMGGEVAVEALRVGDLAVTGSGALRPIRWTGHRTVECRRHPQASLVMPVRIAIGAFGPGKPARDLTVSPAHAICVEAEGGEVLIPAVRLINGTTVARIEVESVTYWHVELDSHDILIAQGLPAESYLDCGNRHFFANAAVTGLWAMPDERPDGTLPFCRPFHEAGPVVEAVRLKLEQRAQALGWSLDAEPSTELHIIADGRVIHPDMDGMSANFVLPAGARDVRLVSGTSAPAYVVSGSADDRRLGVSIRSLVFDDGVTGAREIALNDPKLAMGFHPVDRDASGTAWRWTDGSAALPASLWAGCQGTIRVQVALAGSALPRWVSPRPKADVVAMGGLRKRA